MPKKIIVPKNREAEITLDNDTASSEQLIEWNLTDDEFYRLWNSGIFILINEISNSLIDDYEDEHIKDLNLISDSLIEIKKIPGIPLQIIKMFEEALMYKTSIHFYF
jgi:hypothetical protein